MLRPQQVEKAPTVTPLQSITCDEGTPLRLESIIEGHPAPKVQWYREGAIIPQSRDFEVRSSVVKDFFVHCIGELFNLYFLIDLPCILTS